MSKIKKREEMTEEQQFEFELQLESELARLKRQQRILESSRGDLLGGPKFLKQRRLINILNNENNEILKDLNIATSSTRKREDARITEGLHDLLHENDNFDLLLKRKKSDLHAVDQQIDMVKKNLIKIRKKLPTDNQYLEKVLQGQKTLEALDNKLETATKRCCEILTENTQLRETIATLFEERKNFNVIWERLIEALNKGKKFMVDLIEQSTIAYNQREEWCAKLQALRIRAQSDLIVHTNEMVLLERKVDNENKLEQFLKAKGARRNMCNLKQKELLKRKEKSKQMREKLQHYKDQLSLILDFSGAKNVNELEQLCEAIDFENFSTFNCIISINEEIEDVTHSIVTLQCKIDEEQQLRNERAQHQTENIEKLRHQLERTTKQADHEQDNIDEGNKLLNQYYAGIKNLFDMCKCSKAPFIELLGDNTTMNEYNVILYLEVLEDKISELIMNQHHSEMTSLKKAHVTSLINDEQRPPSTHCIEEVTPTNPCPLCVQEEMVQDIIDSIQFVNDRQEVIARLKQRLELPGGEHRLHNVSVCNLPMSRQIVQKRYQ